MIMRIKVFFNDMISPGQTSKLIRDSSVGQHSFHGSTVQSEEQENMNEERGIRTTDLLPAGRLLSFRKPQAKYDHTCLLGTRGNNHNREQREVLRRGLAANVYWHAANITAVKRLTFLLSQLCLLVGRRPLNTALCRLGYCILYVEAMQCVNEIL